VNGAKASSVIVPGQQVKVPPYQTS
jgi:hypothetical protein